MLKRLFGYHLDSGDKTPVPVRPTIVLVPEDGKDGSTIMVRKALEPLVSGPLVGMSYDDFSIHALIAAGISPKDITIATDGRLGMDDEINALNDSIIERADKLFNSKDEK